MDAELILVWLLAQLGRNACGDHTRRSDRTLVEQARRRSGRAESQSGRIGATKNGLAGDSGNARPQSSEAVASRPNTTAGEGGF